MPADRPLTPHQALFVSEYLIDLNATQAAIRCGYSAKHADVTGPRLLGNVRIGAAIAAGQAERAKRVEITAERVLAEFGKIAFAGVGDYDGQLKLADKLHALDSVAKHLGMFKERHELTGGDGTPLVDTSKIALVLLNILSKARRGPDEEPG